MAIYCTVGMIAFGTEEVSYREVVVEPQEVMLRGASERRGVLVAGKTEEGKLVDLTHGAGYRSKNEKVVVVSPEGVIRPTGNGRTEVEIEAAGQIKLLTARKL